MYSLPILSIQFSDIKYIHTAVQPSPLSISRTFSFFYKFIYFILFIFGCVGSSLLRAGFLQLQRAGATLRCGVRTPHCGVSSCCEARALGAQASIVVARRLSSCGLRALERRLSSFGTWAQLLRSMQDLPRPGIKPVSPALAGGFLTTAPPGKSLELFHYPIIKLCLPLK